MRKLTWPVVLLAAFALMGASDGCEPTTTDEPDQGAPSDEPKKKREKKARIGDSITVEGASVKLRVTVLEVLDPVEGGEFDQAEPGKRYVGVQVQIENVGESSYSDSPSNGAQVVTDTKEQASSTLLTDGDCASEFGSNAKISPGMTLKGCLPFTVDEGQQPRLFQFTADSGFAQGTAEWRLR